MGRIDMEATTSEQERVETIDDVPPPMEDDHDLYEPPPPSTIHRSTPPPPQPHPDVHQFPPPPPSSQDPHPHFPPPQPFPPPPAVHQFPPPNDVPDNKPPPPHQVMGQAFTPPPQQQIAFNQFTSSGGNEQGIPLGIQYNQLPTQPWSSQLFDCMKNPQNAVITLLFPCVTFGQIAEILDSGSTSCGTSGMLYSAIMCCIAMPCIMSFSYRSKLRSKYGLIESPAPDWLVHCFCEYCALCQEYRELEQRGFDPSIGWLGNVAKQQQKQQQFGMTPPMQQRML